MSDQRNRARNSMILDENPTYYDMLEVSPDASPTEIRESYLRLKSAYSRGSVALYTLMDREETENMLDRIEQAYQILSNKEKRRDYDRNHGFLSMEGEIEDSFRSMSHAKIISIDRVPPMETSDGGDLLVAPTTDFTAERSTSSSPSARAPMAPTSAESPFETEDDPFSEPVRTASLPVESPFEESSRTSSTAANPERPVADFPTHSPVSAHVPVTATAPRIGIHSQREPADVSAPGTAYANSLNRRASDAIEYEIQQQTEWSGAFLKKVREARNISLEEMAEFTKITRTYIRAIEEEDYAKLPAAVYLRGFVLQMGKKLRLPHEKVAAAYVARYRKACPDKA